MNQSFIIMQIGNEQLDKVCEEAIVPALKVNNLDPKRVDKHNRGNLLKSEIVSFIGSAEIIVADITNERPNCYLEIGYAMGLDKFRNLILTCREDHHPESPNHKQNGPKVHFDLSGYDILFWSSEDLGLFKSDLTKRIQRRLKIISAPESKLKKEWDMGWVNEHRKKALAGLLEVGYRGWFEFWFSLVDSGVEKSPRDLLDSAEKANINTFGWPLGVVLRGAKNPDWEPRPVPDGVMAELKIKDEPRALGGNKNSYDYWVLRTNGDYFLLISLFEDEFSPQPAVIKWNTRIVRATEMFLFCARLYDNLGVERTDEVNIRIGFGGLNGRTLAVAGQKRTMIQQPKTTSKEISKDLVVSLAEIESNLVGLVKQACEPLFMQFNFYKVEDTVYEEIVNHYVAGKAT